MATARLWVTVEYFHPYLAYRDIDWEGALVTALPKIRAASNEADYRDAVAALLGQLQDPETHLLPAEPRQPESSAIQLSLLRSANSVAFLTQPGPTETTVIDLAVLRAAIRLSEPITSLPTLRPPKPEPADPYPSTELRLLAAIKTWGVIHYFFAYKDLMDEDWDDVFASYLPKFIAARDATDYNLTLADLLTHLTDSNTAPHSKTLDAFFGEFPVGLRLRLLDKYPIVSDVLDPAAGAAGVRPGDVLKRVGSESITDRFRRFVQYVPASTPQRSGFDTIQKVTSGPAATDVELSIENDKGEAHPVTLTRKDTSLVPQRSTERVRVMPGNIGYLDLDRLTPEAAEAAFTSLKDTKAIIFDLRGKAPAAAIIASHLTAQGSTAAALVTTPLALHPDVPTKAIATQTASTFVVQTLPTPRAPLYKGKTLALVDERTIGEAEYAALLFEAAAKTEFVGAPTAGAESSLAELALPGAITVTYSTQDIRHGNGGKLQRLGIQPNIPAPTTAKGLRAGKDEPLAAAIAHLAQ
jgi:C-terminal processing protease CtpA/Prc